ncbi:Histidine kinase-, DNA gyrase B-, and HSP90-like ATPase [Marinospirillum celere]|uniref:histidine kinase n=1 Tax=Marinospirillum celere TaxID=1122252 RepID=A0A1I1FM99_9GAMM|nr:HAMP domain-containing sensor histidine kinase [Marinospirillum celere]SFC00649.1 Histidine kinase-, DNA gyrase B-, and HSP90-like ATPase [Marinospirillum celere]
MANKRAGKLGIFLLLALLACLGNYFAVPLLFGVSLLLGSIFIYLLLFYYGLPLTLVAAIPAYLLTWLLWGHPWGTITHLLELILVAGLLSHYRFRELPLLVAIYWLLLGIPGGLLIYHQVLGLPWLDAWMIIGKQALNSLANATLALTLIYLLPDRLGLRKRPEMSITDLFFYLPTLMLVLGSLVIVMITGHFQMERAQAEIQQQLRGAQSFVVRQLDQKLGSLHDQLSRINQLCQSTLDDETRTRQCYDRQVIGTPFQELLLRPMSGSDWNNLTSFSRLDEFSQSLNADLESSLRELQETGRNRTQRLTDTGELLLVRRVFNDYLHQNWLVARVDLSELNLDLLAAMVYPELRYIWQLGEQELLANQAAIDPVLPLAKHLDASKDGQFLHWLPDEGATAVGRWGNSIYYLQNRLENLGIALPGSIRIELRPRQMQENLFSMYALLFGLSFLLILVGLLITRLVSVWIARPVKDLIKVAENIPSQLPLPIESWRWSQKYPVLEFNQLGVQLETMGRLLKEQFGELQEKEQRLEEVIANRTRELVDAHQHLQSVMDSMEAVLWSADLQLNEGKALFKLNFISPSVLYLTGYSARAWLGDAQGLIRRGLDKKQVAGVLQELGHMAQRGRGRLVMRFWNPKEEEWRVMTLRYWLVYSAEGRPLRVDGLITDMTETYEAEEKVKEQEELLLHQSRRAAMGEMVSNIAHQWRQPLNSLRLTLGNLQDAREFGQLTEDLFDDSLQQADKLITQMNQTVRDFVTFFRPRKEARVFNLADLVDQSLDVMQTSLQSMELHLDVDKDIRVKGYPNEVLQVIMVILQNSREAIKDQKGLAGEVWITLKKEKSQALLTLEDNAGGIPEEAISKVFDPYFTTKAEGTGIGLYMAKMVIEKQMQGEIQVVNSAKGALFTLAFPLTDESVDESL